jgi:hypothetical protein
LIAVEFCKIVEGLGGIRGLGAKDPLRNLKRPLVERLGFLVTLLIALKPRQVVEALSGIWVLGA